jgi:hypothetical protein
MADLHIDEFYADSAKAILALHRSFPRPIVLYVEDICGPDEPDEYGVHSPRHQSCLAAILWLAEEGYIRYTETIRSEAVDQAVLTGRCFAALHGEADGVVASDVGEVSPSVHKRRSSVVYRLEQAVRSKSSSEIEAAFLPLLDRMH